MKTLSNIASHKAAALLAATFLFHLPSAFGGAGPSSADTSAVMPAPDPGLFCFLDGTVCFDLEERVRLEVRSDNFDFNDSVNPPTDDTWLLQRFRLGVLARPASWLKLYMQGQDSREIDSERPNIPGAIGAEGDDWFDLRQAWIEFANYAEFPIGVKIGRQVLSYGDERLLGGFDWNNFARTFDAVKLSFQQKPWSIDVFAASVVSIRRDEFNTSDLFNGNETDRDQVLAGLYVSTTAIPVQVTEIYAFYLHQNESPFASLPNNDTNFATLGARIKAEPKTLGGIDYSFESALQSGEVRGQRLTSFAVHGGAGYHFLDWAWKPAVLAEYNFATGDDNPTDDTIETFQNLFPTNHKFYGYMDLFSWQNIHNPAISIKASPCKGVTVQLAAHAFWLATNEDSWYRANGVTRVRPINDATRDADSYVGSEIDFTATYAPASWLSFLVGYSHFFAGDYLKSTGASDDADFAYLQTTVKF